MDRNGEMPSKLQLFYKDLYHEYLNMSPFRRKMAWENGVVCDIGYINGCYYGKKELEENLELLKKQGYIDIFALPNQDLAFACFTEKGLAYGEAIVEAE